MPRIQFFSLDDFDVFLPHRGLLGVEELGFWCLLRVSSSRWGRLGKTLRGRLLWTYLVASTFEVMFQLSQCDVALPSAVRGLYLLLAFLMPSWSPL
jgi:hypothetical protein